MNRCFARLILITVFTGWSLNAHEISTLIEESKPSYNEVKNNILKSAEWMPEENYAFRPTPGSRTFGQLIGDVARSQADVCSAIAGDRSQVNGAYSTSKADLVAALKESIRKCDSAYGSVNTFNAGQEVGFGSMRHSKLALLFLNAAHDNDLYGQLATYLRLKGFLPPSAQARVVPID
ncbi:MAG: DinB family protein [Acidobacteriota bacterium]|nr:DinB family protein [Acidobacteriota bacterium]MDQ2844527.1 DinB family protein [Acidobacteriota bacterium]